MLAFTHRLGRPVRAGMVAAGRFDGRRDSLAFVTGPDQVVVHTPPDEYRELAVSEAVTALGVGETADGERAALLVGTASNLLAYDVHLNSDVFYKDVPDGVSAVAFGRLPGHDAPLAVAGGNCSVAAYDRAGAEQYWTVAGDTVSALCFDARGRLCVASEDYDVRVGGAGEGGEVTEADAATALAAASGERLAFALANGTVGVLERGRRLWARRSKHRARGLVAFDASGDGTPEVVAGWSDGSVEAMRESDGRVVWREQMGAPVAGVVVSRGTLMVVAEDGTVRGFSPADGRAAGGDADALRARRADLRREIDALRRNHAAAGAEQQQPLPTDTLVTAVAAPSARARALHLVLSTSNDTVIHAAAVETGSGVLTAFGSSDTLTVPLGSTGGGGELRVRAVVGGGPHHLHTFELLHRLPRFPFHEMTLPREVARQPRSHVTLRVKERPQRVTLWMALAFGLDDAARAALARNESVHVAFTDVRTGEAAVFTAQADRVRLAVDSMAVAADMVQDLCAYLRAGDVEAVAEFEADTERLAGLVRAVEEHSAARASLAGGVAEAAGAVRGEAVRGEDARRSGDARGVREAHARLRGLNGELAGEHHKRAVNHRELVEALREVNLVVQRAARLRSGKPREALVKAARDAIRERRWDVLERLVRVGVE